MDKVRSLRQPHTPQRSLRSAGYYLHPEFTPRSSASSYSRMPNSLSTARRHQAQPAGEEYQELPVPPVMRAHSPSPERPSTVMFSGDTIAELQQEIALLTQTVHSLSQRVHEPEDPLPQRTSTRTVEPTAGPSHVQREYTWTDLHMNIPLDSLPSDNQALQLAFLLRGFVNQRKLKPRDRHEAAALLQMATEWTSLPQTTKQTIYTRMRILAVVGRHGWDITSQLAASMGHVSAEVLAPRKTISAIEKAPREQRPLQEDEKRICSCHVSLKRVPVRICIEAVP